MNAFRNIFFFLCLMLISARANAVNIPLQNVTDDDLKKVIGDMSANFLHTSVSGAGTLGHLYGFELGLIYGQTSSPHLHEVARKADATADASKLMNAEILAALTVPFGITAELGLVPSVGNSDFKFKALDLAVKWTITELFFSDLPFNLAGKVAYTTNDVTFSQKISGTQVDYAYANKETSAMALISKNLAILEPYAGIGMVNAKGDLSATTAIYQSGARSANSSRSGMMWQVGTEVKLLVVKLGVEYANLLDTSRFSGKLSVYF